MEGSTSTGQRTLTPAVLASALFLAACAVFAITFVAARGGLQMPVAPTGSAAAIASVAPSEMPSEPAPTVPAATASPVITPAPSPTPVPSTTPTEGPSPTPADPLLALAPCPDRPGCYEYVIQRNDTLSHVADRYAIPISIVLALNPEISDPSVIVVGRVLYLGRDPRVRLEPCPDDIGCWLYVVQPGDRLATIASRYGMTIQAILDTNPAITDENTIYSGQVIRLFEALG